MRLRVKALVVLIALWRLLVALPIVGVGACLVVLGYFVGFGRDEARAQFDDLF